MSFLIKSIVFFVTSFTFSLDNDNSGNIEVKSSSKPRKIGARAVAACVNYTEDIAAPLGDNILGGKKAEPGEFPHMAALGYRDRSNKISWNCAGSLISEKYVLSAAHCFANKSSLPVAVRLGQTVLDSDQEKFLDINLEVRMKFKASDNLYFLLRRTTLYLILNFIATLLITT